MNVSKNAISKHVTARIPKQNENEYKYLSVMTKIKPKARTRKGLKFTTFYIKMTEDKIPQYTRTVYDEYEINFSIDAIHIYKDNGERRGIHFITNLIYNRIYEYLTIILRS